MSCIIFSPFKCKELGRRVFFVIIYLNFYTGEIYDHDEFHAKVIHKKHMAKPRLLKKSPLKQDAVERLISTTGRSLSEDSPQLTWYPFCVPF